MFKPVKREVRTKGSSIAGKVNYRDNKFYILINNKEYEVVYNIEEYKTLYSLPTNDKHPAYTKRKVSEIKRPDTVKLYWSPLKEGMKVKGNIVNAKFVMK